MNQDLLFSLAGYGIITASVFMIGAAGVFTPDWEDHSREDARLVLLAWAWPVLLGPKCGSI